MAFEDPSSPEEVRLERKVQVALGYRLLAAQRWGDLGDGHISARDPERSDGFWLLRGGVSYHEVTIEDLVLVGPNGSLMEGEGIINMAGYSIHHPILEARPDALSACHVRAERVAEAHMKARNAKPISAGAARYAKQDLERLHTGTLGFLSMVQRHVPDRSAVLG